MKTIITGLALAISITCMGQNVSEPQDYEAKENLRELGSTDGTGNIKTFDNRYEGVRGTPYIFEAFLPGEVFLKSKSKIAVKELNYNCFENEIAYNDPVKKTTMLMNPYQVEMFVLINGDERLTFAPVKLKEDSEIIFAQVLYNKGSLVYKVFQKDFVKANYEGGYSADRKYDEFVDKYDLFFMKEGELILYKAKKSKKQMLSAFPGKEKEISSFIKSNKLDLKEEDALVSLLEYYDSL
jgi:hypothetical protein